MPLEDKKELPKHLTKGGPGDNYLGDGKVDTSGWFSPARMGNTLDSLDIQIKNQDIWFCSAPFQMIYTDTKGNFSPCSWAEEGRGPNIKDVPFKQYFIHDDTLNQLRREMLDPDSDHKTINDMCRSCKYQEKTYGRSRRQASLKIQTNNPILWPGLRKSVYRFKESNGQLGHIEDRVFEVQIKAFGNQCNLDCYMCMPFDSSTRLATMHTDHLKKQKVFNVEAITPVASIENITMDSIIDQIVDISPYIYHIKFIGGEPLVMKQFYTLMERLIETGETKRMNVKYQTNMSVMEFDKISINQFIPEFRNFEFTVSLDSIGKYNDYIRRRSNWDDIVNNCKSVLKYPNVTINVNGAISFLSVLRFYELIEWFDENSNMFDQINWSNIRAPERLGANVLPIEIKETLIDKYKNFPDIVNLLKEDNHGIEYQDTLEYLLMVDNRYKGTKWEMNLFEVFPELEEFYIPR